MAKKATDAGLPQAQANSYANAQVDATDADAKTALDKLLADRQAIKDDLKQKALDAGLSNSYSQKYADDNVDTASDKTQAALNQAVKSATVAEKGTSNATPGLSESRGGVSISTVNQSSIINGVHKRVNETTKRQEITQTYNQEYSVATGKGEIVEVDNHIGPDRNDSYLNVTVKGLETQDAHVPTIGRAAYTGEAFSLLTGDGKFDYLVNFDERTGSGKITGFNVGTLELAEGELTKVNLDGKSVTGVSSKVDGSVSGDYTLGLYGTQAQEIAGKGSVSNGKTYQIGFGGKQNAERLAEIETEEKRADLTKQATEAGLTESRIESFVNDNVKSSDKDIAAALQTAVDKLASDKAPLIEQAKNVGLTDEFANRYANTYVDTAKEELKNALDNVAKEQATQINAALLDKRADKEIETIFAKGLKLSSIDHKDGNDEYKATQYIYRQNYSIAVGTLVHKDIKNGSDLSPRWGRLDTMIDGLATTETALPTVGTAVYKGKGYHTEKNYDLTYTVDFSNRVGRGEISGDYILTHWGNKVNLNEGQIGKVNLAGKELIGISGTSTGTGGSYTNQQGTYTLGFFGTEAQEIAGILIRDQSKEDFATNRDNNKELMFGGTRGEIKK